VTPSSTIVAVHIDAGEATAPALHRTTWLRVRDAAGNVGVGEASPLPGYAPESPAQARHALRQAGAALVGRRLAGEASIAAILDDLIDGAALADSPAAASALECALLDLIGQQRGLPVCALLVELLGTTPPRWRSVPLASLVRCSDDPARAVEETARARARGIGTVKVKIGRPGAAEAELATVRALRHAFGTELELRLDANRAFARGEAEARLAQFAAVAPSLIEEPVDDGRWDLLGVRPIPIAADEALQARHVDGRLEAALAAGYCQALVLKPTVLGGVRRCLELARLGARHGATIIVTHTDDGPIAMALASHLAIALASQPGVLVGACGLDHHPGLADYPPFMQPLLRAAHIDAPRGDRAGLGTTAAEPGA